MLCRPLMLLIVGLALTLPEPGHAQSSLADLFHGAQPKAAKAPPPKVAATVSIAKGVTADSSTETFLRSLSAGLKARDATTLLPLLASDYRIDGLPSAASARDTFRQAIERMKSPASMVVAGIEQTATGRTARVEFHYSETDIKVRALRFNSAGLLQSSDMFKIQVQGMGH